MPQKSGNWKKWPEEAKYWWDIFRSYPWLAFLPENVDCIRQIDNYQATRVFHQHGYSGKGLSIKELRATPEFLSTMGKTHGVPREFTSPQKIIMASDARDRFMVGANRCGKTLMSALEAVWWAKGRHPFLKVPEPPNMVWVCAPDWPNYLNPINRKMLSWALGKKGKDNYNFKLAERIFEVFTEDSEGNHVTSRIVLKSYDSGAEKFGGEDVDLICNDEPPPPSVYEEEMMRLGENPLHTFWSLTPVGSNAPWIYTDLYRPWLDEGKPTDKIFVNLAISDNPHLPKDDVERARKKYANNPDAAKVRLEGEWSHIGGLLYPILEAEVHYVDDFKIPGVHRAPRDDEVPWTLYRGLDPGIRNNAGCVWVAVDPLNNAFVYRDFSKSGYSIPEKCAAIQMMQEPTEVYRWSVIDMAAQQRDYASGLPRTAIYAENGVVCLPVKNTDVVSQVSTVKEAFAFTRDDDGNYRHEPKLRVFRSCIDTWRQLSRAAWKTHKLTSGEDPKEQTLKRDDDLENSLRYLICAHGGPVFAATQEAPTGMEGDPVTGYI